MLLTHQATLFWSVLAGNDLLFFAELGPFSAVSHILSIIAFCHASASTLAPPIDLELLGAVLIGYPRASAPDLLPGQAARLLRTSPASLDYINVVQIGLSEGQVRVGPDGGVTRRAYGMMGDEVNLAARLMQFAASGQVVVSKRVADRSANHYHFQTLGSVIIKGKQEPIPIFELLEKQTGPPGSESNRDPNRRLRWNIVQPTIAAVITSVTTKRTSSKS